MRGVLVRGVRNCLFTFPPRYCQYTRCGFYHDMGTDMGFYDDKVIPRFINLACGSKVMQRLRSKVVPQAEGRVLEVGMGPGHNLPFYDPARVDMVWGLEPCHTMRRLARSHINAAPFDVQWLELPGEEIPLEDNSADTVLLTFTLCTIPDWRKALAGMRRVLKPGGRLIFCEHGRAPEQGVQRWQDRINPGWKKLAGGCNLNRPIEEYIESSGFRIVEVEHEYMRKTPRIVGYTYRGFATSA